MKNKTLKRFEGYAYIGIWLFGFFALQLAPLVTSFWYSFTDFEMIGGADFIGIRNYADIFKDPDFLLSLKVTFEYVLIAVPGKIIFALIIALILSQKLRAINIFRTLYYIPSILGGSVAISVLWRYLFMEGGVINNLLSVIGIQGPNWLGDPKYALGTISLVTIWQFGSSMLLFLAGIKQIPVTYYEAAEIDGASKLRRFFSITLPELSPIVLFNVVMQMINAFQEFTPAYVITNGGPLKSTYLYGLMLYETGFEFFHMGYASALSWILFAIIIAFTLVIFKFSELHVHYGDE